ncbi:tRNA (uracil-5-)-methyltransferase homolog A-like [Haliotis asinina]|uniref:tRNA (uracil-5-)-methyltransferase homolog A-like n=1 Tax=Haliotis asinina TaxID=109174 RepID=UPI003531CFEB
MEAESTVMKEAPSDTPDPASVFEKTDAVDVMEDKVDVHQTDDNSSNLSDDGETVAMETAHPYSYTQRKEFTSEIYKVEIENLPRHYGFAQLKKRLSTALKLNPHKIKAMPQTNFAFVTFKNAEDRDAALAGIEGHVWKGKVLRVKKAQPAADPLLKKRKLQEEQQGEKKLRVDKEDDTPSNVRLLKCVAPYWGVPYEEQLKRKQADIVDVLKWLGSNGETRHIFQKQRKENDGLCCKLFPIKPSPLLVGYRNKSEFSIGKGVNDEDVIVGFRFGLYKDGHCNVGPPDDIPIIPDSMKKVVQAFQHYLTTSQYSVFNPENHSGHWHQLTVRTTTGKDVMAIAEFHPQQLNKEALEVEKELIRVYFTEGNGRDSGVTSLYFHQSRARASSEKNEPYELVYGETHIYEDVLGLKFRISPDAFFQVNTKAAEVLYSQLGEWCGLTSATTVLDICCGTGTIGLTLAKRVEKVIGVEMCQQAVEDAKENAKLNGVTNVRYYCGKAEDVISHMTSSLWSRDVVAIVDPPRAGLHKKVIKALRGCHKLKRLIYVACNAKSAKTNFIDLIRMESNKHRGAAFLPVKAMPVDLFPQTPHCELIILFERDMDYNRTDQQSGTEVGDDTSSQSQNARDTASSQRDNAQNTASSQKDSAQDNASSQKDSAQDNASSQRDSAQDNASGHSQCGTDTASCLPGNTKHTECTNDDDDSKDETEGKANLPIVMN